MIKKILLFLLLVPAVTNCEETANVSNEEKLAYIGHDKNQVIITAHETEELCTTKIVISQATLDQLYDLAIAANRFATCYHKHENHGVPQKMRSISTTLIYMGIGGIVSMLATGGAAWMMFGEYIDLIIGFKDNMGGLFNNISELQKECAALKESYEKLVTVVDSAKQKVEKLLDLAQVTHAVNKDNQTLKKLLLDCIEKEKILGNELQAIKIIAGKLAEHKQLSPADIEQLQKDCPPLFQQIEPLTDEKKAALVKEYNKKVSFFGDKYDNFEVLCASEKGLHWLEQQYPHYFKIISSTL